MTWMHTGEVLFKDMRAAARAVTCLSERVTCRPCLQLVMVTGTISWNAHSCHASLNRLHAAVALKACSRCGETKPASDFNANKVSSRKGAQTDSQGRPSAPDGRMACTGKTTGGRERRLAGS